MQKLFSCSIQLQLPFTYATVLKALQLLYTATAALYSYSCSLHPQLLYTATAAITPFNIAQTSATPPVCISSWGLVGPEFFLIMFCLSESIENSFD